MSAETNPHLDAPALQAASGPVLTPHPFQRAGAWALAVMTDAEHPEQMGLEAFLAAHERVTGYAAAAARVDKAKQDEGIAGAFWLHTLMNIHFPNSPGMQGNTRGNKTPDDRELELRQHRSPSAYDPDGVNVPCALCARPAAALANKSMFPLAPASGVHNDLPHRVAGFPLCFPCLASGWALPHASHHTGGSSLLYLTEDEQLQRKFTSVAVRENGRLLGMNASRATYRKGREPREVVITELRSYRRPTRDGVQLWVYTNSNQSPRVTEAALDGAHATWFAVMTDRPARETGWDTLTRVAATKNETGLARLSREVFTDPDRLWRTTTRILRGMVDARSRTVRREFPTLVALLHDLFTTGLANHNTREGASTMDTTTRQRIDDTAQKISELIRAKSGAGGFHEFRRAIEGGPKEFAPWLRSKSADWLLLYAGDRGPLVDVDTHDLLVPSETTDYSLGYRARDLLYFAVIQDLHRQEWLSTEEPEDPAAEDDEDDVDTEDTP